MLTISAEAAAAVRRSWVMHTRVDSWRGAQLLAEDIPVSSGTHETDLDLRIPDRVTLTVPRLDRGVSWDPSTDTGHPLAAYGQRLRICVGVELAHHRIEWIQRGWYLIQDADCPDDEVRITAATLTTWVDEARLTAPYQPTGTMVSTLRALVEPALTVDVTAAPTDRAVPAGLSWDEDRLAAVYELLDAWPAAARVDATGALVITAPPSGTQTVDLDLVGVEDVVVASGGGSTRDGALTCVVARGEDANGTPVQGVALDLSGGPLDATGAFNPLPVPEFFFSPLLTTVDQCQQAASTILARRRRQVTRPRTVIAVPNPALEAGDVVSLGDEGVGVVQTLRMPLTPADGPMELGARLD